MSVEVSEPRSRTKQAPVPRLSAALLLLLLYHAGLYPQTAEPVIAASGLHAQKPQRPTSAVTAAAMHPQR